jgi:hypothetical protein
MRPAEAGRIPSKRLRFREIIAFLWNLEPLDEFITCSGRFAGRTFQWRNLMKLSMLLCASALAIASITPVAAQTATSEADCTAMMTKADTNADGSLAAAEATPYLAEMTKANVTPATAGTITKDEFMAQCVKGGFAAVPPMQ